MVHVSIDVLNHALECVVDEPPETIEEVNEKTGHVTGDEEKEKGGKQLKQEQAEECGSRSRAE